MGEDRLSIPIAWDKISEVEDAMREKRKGISETPTPKSQVKRRPDGLDYVEEKFMRHKLDEHYPIWSWESSGNNPIQILGSEYVVATGKLVIFDEGVTRSFFSPGAARIMYKKDKKTGQPLPHTIENMVDLDKNVASANTFAFKRAINRLTHISDDVYRKQVEMIDLHDAQIDVFKDIINSVKDEDKREEILLWFAEQTEKVDINQKNYEQWLDKIKTTVSNLNEKYKNKKKGDK